MAKRKADQEEVVVKTTAPVQGPVVSFYEKYQKEILYAVAGILGVALLYFGYKKFIQEPKQTEAVAAMWQAQAQFDRDSFELALKNPGAGFDGFEAIADKYSGSKAGNIANYYAGICNLRMGNIDAAIEYLEKFSPDEEILGTTKYGVLGDCYSEKGDFEKAIDMYEKASNGGNETVAAIYLKKLGMLNEKQGNREAALAAYERLRREFPNPQSADWREIEKYIYRAGGGQQ
jgi:tetratricopeptide (TPR) repeat protein